MTKQNIDRQKVIDAMADKIDELQDKIDIKDDALIAQTLVIDCIKAENAALKRNQENSVKMFKELLIMLDKVAEK